MLIPIRLFGDGKHGHAERIQTFRCQACRTTFSARPDRPLYLLTPPHTHAMRNELTSSERRGE
jgi:transposase-like protein